MKPKRIVKATEINSKLNRVKRRSINTHKFISKIIVFIVEPTTSNAIDRSLLLWSVETLGMLITNKGIWKQYNDFNDKLLSMGWITIWQIMTASKNISFECEENNYCFFFH